MRQSLKIKKKKEKAKAKKRTKVLNRDEQNLVKTNEAKILQSYTNLSIFLKRPFLVIVNK